jgi:hypothetical protein
MASIQHYLNKIDVRHIAILLSITCIIVCFHPLFLVMPVSQMTQQFYNAIAALKPGDAILWGNGVDGNTWNSYIAYYTALFQYMASKHIKLVMVGFTTEWPSVIDNFDNWIGFQANYGYVYGTDYVFLPYSPGEETAMASIARSIPGTFSTDARGNSLANMPIIQSRPNLVSFNLIFIQYGIFTWADMYVRQWAVPAYNAGIPTIADATFTTVASYYGKYIVGDLDLLRGYSEFEYLLKASGEELIRMDIRDVNVLITLGLIALTNIALFISRGEKKGETAKLGVK